jgi:hypothetical protein
MVIDNVERQRRYRARQKALRDWDLARVRDYRRKRDAAQRVVDQIDAGMRFEQGLGDGPMRDVTAERRAEKIEEVKFFEGLARRWEADHLD